MDWVFIALVVAVVAAVAMVAVGRGDGLAPALPDRPDVELPADRALTATDLADLKLSVAVRGYRMDEVDALLGRLAAELSERDAQPPAVAQPPVVAPSPVPQPLVPQPLVPQPVASQPVTARPVTPQPGAGAHALSAPVATARQSPTAPAEPEDAR